MNAIQYALSQIRHSIPQQILDLAFVSSNQIVTPRVDFFHYTQEAPISIDAQIRDKVIESRVNIDCNLKGGHQVGIDLRGVPYEQWDAASRVFRIPYDKTDGRKIVSVQSLNYMAFHGMPGYTGMQGNQIMGAAKDMFNAIANMPIVATSNCTIIGDNVIHVRDSVQQMSNELGMTCLVEFADGMSNMHPGLLRHYSRLVELATKAYIYITLNVSMDQGVLHAGVNLGRIRETVDEYRDANDQYREYFDEFWGKASFSADRPRMANYIQSMLGRGR